MSAPGPPYRVRAVPGDASATLTWLAPSTGGSPIKSYIVTPHAANAALSAWVIEPPVTTATIAGLQNDVAYSFTVTASNAEGQGSPSAASNEATPAAAAVPGPPINALAVGGDGYATVSWIAPPDGGSPIVSYLVTAQVEGVAPVQPPRKIPASATQVTMAQLTNGARYRISVQAVSDIGAGPAATAAVTPMPSRVPDAPGGIRAFGSDGRARVAWIEPPNGGSPLASYRVTPYIGDAPQLPTIVTGSPPPTGVLVTGLENGQHYTFEVTATNAIGSGPPGRNAEAVTPMASSTAMAPYSPGGSDVWSDFVKSVLDTEWARKTTLEQKGANIIATAGAFVTVLFALVGAVTATGTTQLPSESHGWLALAVGFFLVAGVCGVIVAVSPAKYGQVEFGPDDLAARWGQTKSQAEDLVARNHLAALTIVRRVNDRRAQFLRLGAVAELVAILMLGAGIFAVVAKGSPVTATPTPSATTVAPTTTTIPASPTTTATS